MNKRKALIISAILFATGFVFMFVAYFMFHYLTDDGLVHTKLEEAHKPFVTNMVGIFSTLNYFGALVFLLVALINPKQ